MNQEYREKDGTLYSDEQILAVQSSVESLHDFLRKNDQYVRDCALDHYATDFGLFDDFLEVVRAAFVDATMNYVLDEGDFYTFATIVMQRRMVEYKIKSDDERAQETNQAFLKMEDIFGLYNSGSNNGEKTKRLIDLEVDRKQSKSRKIAIVVASIAFVALFFPAITFAHTWDTPAYTVYLDVNPAIRMEVNVFGRVIKEYATNTTGKELSDAVHASGRVETVLEAYIGEIVKHGYDIYIDDTGMVKMVITIASDDASMYGKFYYDTKKVLSDVAVAYVDVDRVDEAEALEYRVSAGKYRLSLQAKQVYPDTDLKHFLNLPISELIELLQNAPTQRDVTIQ
ncbi:MAG: hypothetical protein LBN22_12080 [Clostridiales Family XIII bacterium]|jgi:hypothetical protein|nr:hypothetical protein [Clostridiales Family XIII bacterium]